MICCVMVDKSFTVAVRTGPGVSRVLKKGVVGVRNTDAASVKPGLADITADSLMIRLNRSSLTELRSSPVTVDWQKSMGWEGLSQVASSTSNEKTRCETDMLRTFEV